MLGFMNSPILIAITFALGLAAGGYSGYRINDNIWIAKTEKLKSEAAAELQKATEAVIFQERKNAELANKIGAVHAKSQKEIRATLDENRRLVAAIGGLRDQGRRQSSPNSLRAPSATSGNPVDAAAGADVPAESGEVLSTELSEFILKLAYDADDVATYAKACHEWVKELKK